MKITTEQIRKLREQTGAQVLRVKKVLEEFNGNEKKARDLLTKEGFEKIAKREGRETGQGIITTYLHHNKKIASVIDLESQEFIKDPAKKISDLVKEVIVKTGENIRIGRIFRVELGK